MTTSIRFFISNVSFYIPLSYEQHEQSKSRVFHLEYCKLFDNLLVEFGIGPCQLPEGVQCSLAEGSVRGANSTV